jgi:uncharacterized protein (DUF58 family)
MKSRFLDPKALARISNLPLMARGVVEGFISGLHRSPFRGFSVEFAEYREYCPGDDLRHFDWRVFARNDRRVIKQYQEETNLKAYLLVDASKSMAYGSPGMPTKFEYAGRLAACLAHLLVRQKDAVGLGVFDQTLRRFLPPRATRVGMLNLLEALEGVEPSGPTRAGEALHRIAERIRRKSLLVVLSDLLDDPVSVRKGLRHLRHDKHEVLVFHILDPAEVDFPFQRHSGFRDMETGEEVEVHPAFTREEYRRSFKAFLDGHRKACSESRIDYQLARTDVPFDLFLARYLSKRARLG